MKRIKTLQLMPGMVVAKDVINSNNILVVAKDTVLNDEAITKLTFHSIFYVYINEDSAATTLEVQNPQNPPATSSEEYVSKITRTKEFQEFQAAYEQEIEKLQDVFNDLITLQPNMPDAAELCVQATKMLEGVQNGLQVFDILHNIRDYDGSTFHHSLNVSLICSVFADWMHMSKLEKEIATVSGLLHDIGKLKIPEEIVKKPERLTDDEYRIIQNHPIEGYKILYEAKFNQSIQNAALMHHERHDGSGYPLGLPGERIDKYAKMVAIADVYDAMTAARVYRGKLCPFKVIEMFERDGLSMFDAEYLLVFMENIVQTYLRSRVRLSDGTKGEIIMMNKQRYSKPVIAIKNGFINLLEHPELSIEEIYV